MIFVSPESHKDLILNKKTLVSADGKENYSIIKGVPILLPEKTNPDWSRELIEIIFWEYPEVIKKIHEEIESGNAKFISSEEFFSRLSEELGEPFEIEEQSEEEREKELKKIEEIRQHNEKMINLFIKDWEYKDKKFRKFLLMVIDFWCKMWYNIYVVWKSNNFRRLGGTKYV